MQLAIVPKSEDAKVEPSRRPLAVLKFGSSVLRTIDDLPKVAGEIYRLRRAGWQVVAVVSALGGETDALFAEAAAVSGGVACSGIAELVSLGEERTAALLAIACDRIGLPSRLCRPEALGLTVEGDASSARPVALDDATLRAKLDETGLVIVPGFVGICVEGRRALLGRGGSDLSAVFLAGELGAENVRLYKDVSGVYDRDPAVVRDPRRYAEISWGDAARVAGKLIQPQAIEHAAHHGLPIEVAQIGGEEATRIGACTGAAEPVTARRPLRIALAGFGVVGQALATRLVGEPDFEIVSILVRKIDRHRAVTPPCALTDDPELFLEAGADILIDALSCDKAGEMLCRRLASTTHIVSANKRVVARAGSEIRAIGQGGGSLRCSATVGGAAPILETVVAARAAGAVREVAAVLNGTVNFILHRLAAGASFEGALEEARQAGFAEEDCSSDLEGHDAATKLRLVAADAFGAEPGLVDVKAEVLDAELAAQIRESGERWVQLARLTPERAEVVLRPAGLAGFEPLADEWNSARIIVDDDSVFACVGRGAGGPATAEAIVADLYEVRGSC